MRINGDLFPISSGISHLGVDASSATGFDSSRILPFGHVVQLSGVFVDPILGQSGIIRYSREQAAFQISVDGGISFNNLITGASVVSSVGVIGDANLTGNVDFASPASGFISIFDTGNASPIQWAVDHLGLSGLWGFPAQGFNGSVVNALSDFNGTSAQGAISVVGASGIVVDIIGNTMTITPGNALTKCYSNSFVSSNTWTITHNLNSSDVIVSIYDDSTPRQLIIPDKIELTDVNTVNVAFNTPQAGRAIVVSC